MSELRDKVAIGVTGLPGAGKTTFTEVARSMGVPVFIMGDVIREEVQKRGLPLTRENMKFVMKDIREKLGSDIVAKRCCEKVRNVEDKIVVLEGIRSMEEVRFYKEQFGRFILVAIHASPRTRYERLKRRGRNDDPKDFSVFTERDFQEIEVGIAVPLALADVHLVNEDVSLREFKELCREAIRRILESV